MISRRPGGRRKKIQNFPNFKIPKIYYCYNNNSQPLGRPIFNNIINTTTIIFGTEKTAPWNSPNVEQKILRTKFSGHGAGDATKTGRSVLKFSGESARHGPGARKSPKKEKLKINVSNSNKIHQTKICTLDFAKS